MFHLNFKIKILVLWDIFGIKKSKKTNKTATLYFMEAGVDG